MKALVRLPARVPLVLVGNGCVPRCACTHCCCQRRASSSLWSHRSSGEGGVGEGASMGAGEGVGDGSVGAGADAAGAGAFFIR